MNMVLCVDVKLRRCDDVRILVARDRQGMLYRRCEKIQTIQIC